jgi:hypothetical protein
MSSNRDTANTTRIFRGFFGRARAIDAIGHVVEFSSALLPAGWGIHGKIAPELAFRGDRGLAG